MKVIVVGGGPIGLASAMLLARDGHAVTVLEKDRDDVRGGWQDGWEQWERGGVAQFRQAHFMMPRFRHRLDAELPGVRDRIEKLGGRRFRMTALLPRSIADRSPRPGDERFETLTARRPVLETAFAQVAQETPGVEIIRGVGVEGPVNGVTRSGIPHVTGVRTDKGEVLAADLVVDAMGRRSKLTEWVAALGGRAPYEEASDAGFAYYTRHYASRDGRVPEYRGPISAAVGTFQTLTVLADDDTWTVGLLAMAGDRPLKALRHNEVWARVARAIPHSAHWLEGAPLCDVMPMAGVLDRYRRIVVEGRPVVTGLLPVGDAWACTNPSAGRGISIGLGHAICLRDSVRGYADDPLRLAEEFDRMTEETVTPWYYDQVGRDRRRARAFQALVEGRAPQRLDADPAAGPRPRSSAAWAPIPIWRADGSRYCRASPCRQRSWPVRGWRRGSRSSRAWPRPPLPGPTRGELLALLN